MMGQDKGYMMGQYDGQQNNHTTKWDYTTDVETNMGAATRPKGHYGQSSGGCCSAAASVTTNQNNNEISNHQRKRNQSRTVCQRFVNWRSSIALQRNVFADALLVCRS